MWPDRRLIELLNIEHPIIQAPMAGATDWELAVEVAEAGGLGSIPCGMLTPERLGEDAAKIRARTDKPINFNFLCHPPPKLDNAREAAWRDRLKGYYAEFGLAPNVPAPSIARAPFDAAMCEALLALAPKIVSFHYGLPPPALLKKLKAAGCVVIGCATTAAEARALEESGADAVIAQGLDAGGHRGMFLAGDLASQVGTFALVPQVADAVKVPVIAAGGISDARGIAAALALGAAGVQIGSAFLLCPESKISAPHRAALKAARDDATVLTNVITGRPARGIVNRVIREQGPISQDAPAFPLAANALAPLRAAAEKQGSGDFSPLWAGQAVALGRELPARNLLQMLAAETQERLRRLTPADASTF
jgi:nitronate monooxygenase